MLEAFPEPSCLLGENHFVSKKKSTLNLDMESIGFDAAVLQFNASGKIRNLKTQISSA
jgi:hypothetical protein